MNDRVGDWMQTYTGRQFWVADPRPDEVDIHDIAAALSKLCRYTGHIREFYSVAQHSVLVSLHCDPADALWGLLHDAAEAYTNDVSRPTKRTLRVLAGVEVSDLDAIESAVMAAVCFRFRLPLGMPESVDRADLLLLATEARDLMGPLHRDWCHKEANGYPVLPEQIMPLSWREAELQFLARFAELTTGCAL